MAYKSNTKQGGSNIPTSGASPALRPAAQRTQGSERTPEEWRRPEGSRRAGRDWAGDADKNPGTSWPRSDERKRSWRWSRRKKEPLSPTTGASPALRLAAQRPQGSERTPEE